jgi:hypothetical protein
LSLAVEEGEQTIHGKPHASGREACRTPSIARPASSKWVPIERVSSSYPALLMRIVPPLLVRRRSEQGVLQLSPYSEVARAPAGLGADLDAAIVHQRIAADAAAQQGRACAEAKDL